MEKITVWVLMVNDESMDEVSVHRTQEGALDDVCGDLHDRYHFDTDEPYITQEELAEKQRNAREELVWMGEWQDGDAEYRLEQQELQD